MPQVNETLIGNGLYASFDNSFDEVVTLRLGGVERHATDPAIPLDKDAALRLIEYFMQRFQIESFDALAFEIMMLHDDHWS